MILAGDVGGTKCNLALIEERESLLNPLFRRRYSTPDYVRFDDLIAEFLRDARAALGSRAAEIRAAGFGAAGPVINGRVQLTNLPWSLDAAALERRLGAGHVVLLNDLEAAGYSLACLREADFLSLNQGQPAPRAAQALIAAGTGLGEAILWHNGERYVVAPGEGGHCDFAPRTDQEIELLRHLRKTHPRVSFEMVLSGRGFLAVHEFLDPAVRHPSFDQPDADPAPEITRLGLDGSCRVCAGTLDLWTSLYGAEAGNLALKALARGGVFVAGGIAPKILPKLQDGAFLRAFCAKAPFEDLLSRIPLRVVLNQDAPLIGAAAEAARLLSR